MGFVTDNIFRVACSIQFLILSTSIESVRSFPYEPSARLCRYSTHTFRQCSRQPDNGMIYSDNADQLKKEGGITRSAFLSKSTTSFLSVLALSSLPTENVHALDPARSQATVSRLSSSLTSTTTKSETISETISGFFSGAALSTTKTLVKYPLDTATVRLQMPNTIYSIFEPLELFSGSFRGIFAPLLSNIPGGAVFFAIKDATKSILKQNDTPKWLATCVAVGVANFPYWLIRNPSEVVKTRQQAGLDGYVIKGKDGQDVNIIDAFQIAIKEGDGFKELYSGYWENILYAYPADVLKFLCYEKLTGGKKNVPPLRGAAYGAVSTAVAQFLTTPLDVVRNRVMAKTISEENKILNDKEIDSQDKNDMMKSLVQIWRGEGLGGLFAGATPRIGKAFLSGAIQFATYEETKQSIQNRLIPKK